MILIFLFRLNNTIKLINKNRLRSENISDSFDERLLFLYRLLLLSCRVYLDFLDIHLIYTCFRTLKRLMLYKDIIIIIYWLYFGLISSIVSINDIFHDKNNNNADDN